MQVSNWKASDNLKAAKALIIDPAAWIKRAYEQDEDGKSSSNKPVCKFCTIGAYQRASLTHFGSLMNDHSWYVKPEYRTDHACLLADSSLYLRKAMHDLIKPEIQRQYSGIADYNDDPATTYEDIINLYDKAIEMAEKDEK